MPHNIEAGAADSLGKKDFIVTANYASQWMLEHHYPREKMYILPYFPVNTDIYYPIQLSASDIEKYGCDISFVSNCSETPEENLRKLRERFSCHGKDVDTLLINMYDFVLDKFCRWENYPVNNKEYNDIFQIVHNQMGMPEVPNAIREEITYEFLYVGDRILRQKPLEKLSGDGFNLSLYGIGWESHPVLKKHSRGIAKNGEELNISWKNAIVDWGY